MKRMKNSSNSPAFTMPLATRRSEASNELYSNFQYSCPIARGRPYRPQLLDLYETNVPERRPAPTNAQDRC